MISAKCAAADVRTISLFNPVVCLISACRWNFYGIADERVGIRLAITLLFLGFAGFARFQAYFLGSGRVDCDLARFRSSVASSRNSSWRPEPRRQIKPICRAGSSDTRGRVTRLVPRSSPASTARMGNSVMPSPLSTICTSVARLVASNASVRCRSARRQAASA